MPKTKTVLGEFAFSVAGPISCNSLQAVFICLLFVIF